MYIWTAPIFAMVIDAAIGAQVARTGVKGSKKSGETAKNGAKTAGFGLTAPIVTLWQQWGANFPFTSKLT
ncbi:hypothetical protein LB523_11510 [Mesorhizobium sp. ESP-6-4]|uniref:hypothetical protein n=1 Tax=Mesorhizobium sp. ESP-6-4 TaxID=2876624 RepID=UPI001CCC6F1D|nr:hypothetical protein [Mesorhizobium sp. ESP-6-4]MBZ9659672.1 hypothetical protein [Mesorhizobium sp. ESP-6-4]